MFMNYYQIMMTPGVDENASLSPLTWSAIQSNRSITIKNVVALRQTVFLLQFELSHKIKITKQIVLVTPTHA